MKKLALLALAVVACSRNPGPGTQLTGAADARLAADAFMTAVAAQDLQAMSVVWGTEKGAARDNLERGELDKRLIIIQGCYTHDRYQIVRETAGPSTKRYIQVAVTRGRVTKSPNFVMVMGPSRRWYVEDADFATMRELCRPS